MAKKLTGDLAQTSVGVPSVNTTGTTATGSNQVTALASTVGVAIGASITGTGIPAGSIISNIVGSTVTISASATASGSAVALVIGGETQVIGLKGWSIKWGLKTAEATTTDDSGYDSYLPSTANWTAEAEYVYLEGDVSQTTFIRSYMSALVRVAQEWNFFIDPINGDDAFTGNAFISEIGIETKMGGVVSQKVSLRGTGPLKPTTETTPIPNPNTITGLQAEI